MEIGGQGLDVKVFHGAELNRGEDVANSNILAPYAAVTKRQFNPAVKINTTEFHWFA